MEKKAWRGERGMPSFTPFYAVGVGVEVVKGITMIIQYQAIMLDKV